MKKNSKERILLIVFALVFIALSFLSPDKFLTVTNIRSMAFQLPEFGILTLAMMVPILTGGINLSLVTAATLGGVVSATVMASLYKQNWNETLIIMIAVLTSMVASVLCGIINGYVVSYIGAAAMMATLGTSTLFEGIGLYISKGNSISGFPAAFHWIGNGTVCGVPVPMIVFGLVAVVTWLLLEKTAWGQSVYMVGCNRKAASFSGLNVNRIMMKVYMYSGFLGSLAMLIMMSRYNSARVDYGSSYLMQAVAASVLGGTMITGGYGKVGGVVIAVAILQIISSGFNIFGLDRNLTTVINGVILIGVLTLNFLNEYRKSR
ncbi:ABC transporter permease [Hungatella sp. L12]|uniref:ABC transporter permease n=1 Tax=Hungatella hominis TaxID=2763050 RepID=A0ABR7H504_9FIRM|nr:ABC transporter permease [Hungatella hominis]MBC5708292.1 ABC transporter permease [Hungatella hominis]